MSGVWSSADIRKKNSRTIWTVAPLKIFGGIYLAKVISSVFWNADICSYGWEDRLLHCMWQCKCTAAWLGIAIWVQDESKQAGIREPRSSWRGQAPPGHRPPFVQIGTDAQRVHSSLVSWTARLKSKTISPQVLASLSALQTSFQRICCRDSILCLWSHLNTAKVLLPPSPSLL